MDFPFPTFERASLFGLAALALALVAQVVLNGCVPASWRVWVWRLALLQTALALLPLAPLHLAVLPSDSSLATGPALTAPLILAQPENSEIGSSTAVEAEPLAAPLPALPVARPFAEALIEAWPFWAVVYGLGLAAQLLVLVRSRGQVRRLLHLCTPIEEVAVKVELSHAARNLQLSRLPHLLMSEGGAPCLVGIRRPAIVLPRALLTPQNSDLEAVLLHELAHLKRRDLAWNSVLWLVQSLLWFHPLVWVARRYLALEVESACDEMVLSSTRISPKSYGALLLNTMRTPPTPLAAGVADGFHGLQTRLARLKQAPRRPGRVAKLAFALVVCIALGAVIPLRFEVRAQPETAAVANEVAAKTAATEKAAAQKIIKATGIVSGRVLTPSGKPIPAARVSWVGYGSSGEISAGAVLDSTQTDAGGRFRFANSSQLLARSLRFSGSLMDGMAPQLLIEASGWGVGSASALRSTRRPIAVRLAPSTALAASFLDSQGQVVPGLRVRLSALIWGSPGNASSPWNYFIPARGMKRFEARTDVQGVCRFEGLPQGTQAGLAIDDERFAQLTYKATTQLRQGALTTAPPIRLTPGARVQGRLTYRDSGQPVVGVSVGAQSIDPGIAGGSALSDRNGYYEIKSMGSGSFNIALGLKTPLSNRWTARAHEKVEVAADELLTNLDFQLEPGVLITGRVTAEGSNEPVAGLHIGIYGPAHPHSGAWVQGVATAPDGSYRLRVPAGPQLIYIMSGPPAGFGPQKSAPTGSVPLTRSKAYGNATYDLTLRNGQSATVNWQLPKVKAPVKSRAVPARKTT